MSDYIWDIFNVIKLFNLLVVFVLIASKQQAPIDIGFPTQKNDNISIINSKKLFFEKCQGVVGVAPFLLYFQSSFFQSILFKYCKYLLLVFVV